MSVVNNHLSVNKLFSESCVSVSRKLLTAVASGHVNIWSHAKDSNIIVDTGGPIEKMRHSSINADIIAVGGKENDLKLWNLEQKTCTFAAKSVSLLCHILESYALSSIHMFHCECMKLLLKK